MEFDIDSFTNRLITLISDSVPKESDELNNRKHKNRKGKHLKDLFSTESHLGVLVFNNINTRTFDVGGEYAEMVMPHYHILQNSYAIRKRGRGTKKTKGSQDKVDVSSRDYEKVSWNGKTFSKEYSRNVRGSRKPKNVSYWNNGEFINDRANSYINIHYKYIDNSIEKALPIITNEFGLKMKRKSFTGLKEEYDLQNKMKLEEIFNSHLGGYDYEDYEY